MGIIRAVVEDRYAMEIHVRNMETNEEIVFQRYELIKYIDHTRLGEWLDVPILYTSYNPCNMTLYIFIRR